MYCFLLIAKTGEGKTTTALNIAKLGKQKGKGILVFDYRGEPAYDFLSDDLNNKECRFVGEPKKFLELCFNEKKKNQTIIIEEATIFVRGQLGEDFRKLLVSKRHNGHNIVFLYHSINAVPPEIFAMSDFIMLGKTGDSIQQVDKKRKEIVPFFLKLKKEPRFTFLTIKNS